VAESRAFVLDSGATMHSVRCSYCAVRAFSKDQFVVNLWLVAHLASCVQSPPGLRDSAKAMIQRTLDYGACIIDPAKAA
jgi:hypothetical protein